MRIKCISDVHFEFHRDGGERFAKELPNANIDTLILAGDITTWQTGYEAIRILCDRFPNVIYVLGNHDHYHIRSERLYALIEKELVSQRSNLHFLNNRRIEIDGIGFAGTTLWIPWRQESWMLQREINDFRYVKDGAHWIYNQNTEAVQFLDKFVAKGDVVITHHLPSWQLISEEFAGEPTNIFYADRLDSFIERKQAAYWFHGHSHESCQIVIGDTMCVRNPYGYQGVTEWDGQLNKNFDPDFFVDLP